MPENLQQRLEQSTSGTPMVNPDEQRKYLGTFRERCYLSMTIGQMKQKKLQEAFSRLSLNYPKASILINGCLALIFKSHRKTKYRLQLSLRIKIVRMNVLGY